MTAPTYPTYYSSIPYTSPPTRLQTLDLWLPRPLPTPPPASTLWLIYLHGGAWRDPAQTSRCVQPTIAHLEAAHSSATHHLAAIASLNYRLSPYPKHASDPSDPDDAQRNVAHPSHVQDVQRAIAYLRKEYGVRRWMGVGHSCGATLLMQYVAGIGVERGGGEEGLLPEALVLLEGIYSIPLLLRNHEPPGCPEQIARIYREIVVGAFGEDGEGYEGVSPTAGAYGKEVWPGARLVLLGHSGEDDLVEVEQRDAMVERLKGEGWTEDWGKMKRVVTVRDLKGGHDEIWEEGVQIANVVNDVIEMLNGS